MGERLRTPETGGSGGGPHVLACAELAPPEVQELIRVGADPAKQIASGARWFSEGIPPEGAHARSEPL